MKLFFSRSLGRKLSKWPNDDILIQNEAAGKVAKQKLNQMDVTENGWGSRTQSVTCISASHPCTCPQLSGLWGPGPHASETRTRKWTWAAAGWASCCQSGKGLSYSWLHVPEMDTLP